MILKFTKTYRKLLFILSGLVLLSSNVLLSQSLITKNSFTHTDTSGNFYIQKLQPLYLWLGSTPDSTDDMYLMKSDTSKKYTNPFYFDAEGLNIIRSPWAVNTETNIRVYPLEEIEFEIYADGIAPKTSLKYGNANLKSLKGKNYISSGLSIKLNSTDATSGVYNTYYSIDSSEFKVYEKVLDCSVQKDYLIQYYAIDNVGNIEALKKYAFTVDNTPPTTELNIIGDQHENIISQRSKIELKAIDNDCGVKNIKIRIDKGSTTYYKGQLKASYLKQGEHTLYYYATDQVGNKEIEKTFTFFVDNTAPILVEEVLGNSFMNNNKEYSSGRSKLKLTAVDNKAGIQAIFYSLNGEEYIEYKKPFYLSIISGSLNITSYATDNVNNKSVASRNTAKRNVTYIDLTGPEITYSFKGPRFKVLDSIYINKTTLISLKAIDKESGFKSMDFNIDGDIMKPYSEAFSIEKAGHHKISSTAFDNVNNSNNMEFAIIVDNTGPQVYTRFSILPLDKKEKNGKSISIYSSQVALFLSATDARVAIDKIFYKINDEPEKQYISYIGGFKQGLEYNVQLRATDMLGNETIDNIEFATDNTGPEIFTQFSAPVKAQKEIEGVKINVYPAHVAIFLSVTNAHVAYEKIQYSINGGSEKQYMGVIKNFSAGSDIKLNIRAIDQLGNQTQKEIQFSIE